MDLRLVGGEPRQNAAEPERIVLCGADDRGAMRAVYYLEDKMGLALAPCVEQGDVLRTCLYTPRITQRVGPYNSFLTELSQPTIYTDGFLWRISPLATFTEKGLTLRSGAELEADVVVTATGLNLLLLGGLEVTVDGTRVEFANTFNYKGMMFSDVPNLALAVGYTNASWTLKAELICRYVCRLLNYMDRRGYTQCTPRRNDPSITEEPVKNYFTAFSGERQFIGELDSIHLIDKHSAGMADMIPRINFFRSEIHRERHSIDLRPFVERGALMLFGIVVAQEHHQNIPLSLPGHRLFQRITKVQKVVEAGGASEIQKPQQESKCGCALRCTRVNMTQIASYSARLLSIALAGTETH